MVIDDEQDIDKACVILCYGWYNFLIRNNLWNCTRMKLPIIEVKRH